MTVRRSAPLTTYPRLSFADQAALLGRGIAGNIRAALGHSERPQLPGRAARKTRATTT